MSEETLSIERLTRDLTSAAITLTRGQARYLVDIYYQMQNQRIRSAGQIRASDETEEPNEVLAWYAEQSRLLENQIKRALDHYSKNDPLGEWARSNVGIGPVIAAGLLAHIDISRCQTASNIWSFAGLDPTKKWEKKTKRPFNADLKTLCAFKIGECFVKVCNHDDAFYGHFYAERKKLEIERNEAGKNAEYAKAILERKKIGKTTEAFKHLTQGKLPPAHIHARARRKAVKLFLAHYFEQGYRLMHGKEPPAPYPIAHMGHAHVIEAPNPVALVGAV